MTIEEERRKKRYERDKEMRRVAHCYKRVFYGPDADVVMADLAAAFGYNLPTFLPLETRPGAHLSYDPLYAAIRDGQRQVYLHIIAKLNAPSEPDGNIEEPTEVLTGLSQ